MGGVAFSGILAPTLHVWKGLKASVGVGVGGAVELQPARRNPNPEYDDILVASYTYPSNAEPLPNCVGFGMLGAAQLAYWYPLSGLTSFGIGLRYDYSEFACERSTRRVEPDSAEAILIRQWWAQHAWSASVGLSWR